MGPDRDELRRGLTQQEARARLAADGPNLLPQPARPSGPRRLAAQLVNPFALLLWGAVVLSWLAQLATMAFAIVAVVLANALFSFAQGRRADRAAETLHRLLPAEVAVRRDGAVQQVGAAQLVVGDVLVLEAGDRVPADAAVLAASGLLVDLSTLTGEGEAAAVLEGGALLAGTFVVEGTAEARVTATGSRTRLAGIATATTLVSAHVTPLTAELRRVVRGIGLLALLVGAAFFGLSVVLGHPVAEGYPLALGVTVALVPEALLPTVTLALAWGAEQMARRQVLVRSLDAVETLGSTTFVCTDKTGTLTCNEMTVVEAWVPAGFARVVGAGYGPAAEIRVEAPSVRLRIEALALSGARCSRGYVHEVDGTWRPHGDPMEAAIDAFARRLGLDTDTPRSGAHLDVVFAFDPHRRRMSVLADGSVLAKGAADAILPLCADPPASLDAARAVALEWSARGLRVLAVAGRPAVDHPADAASAEQGLRLVGLLALHDPPRPDVAEALAACRLAGVRVAMITGDHPATAEAIATEVGLRPPDGPVHVGADLPADDDALGALLDRDGVVVARVTPEDKLRIARALRARGHVVAMTGDGVNDGPALREADIGIAMGRSGTDVAREAADLVLLDDHFASIVAGIELGRATFVNVRRFLTYHLTDNVAELAPFVVWGMTGGTVPLALGVLQILALDLGTDTFSAVALGAEPPARTALRRPPAAGRLLDRRVLVRAFGVLGPTEAALSLLAFGVSLGAAGWRPGSGAPEAAVLATASGAAFATVVLGQAANAFACRSATRPPWVLGWWSNPLLGPAV
ncbi:cation-translocating P-type ATPase, partial [Actinotalea sp.]|uniref:cation-translocating P-type ATPase n=1 Tax=Actinotalea sp. TaxID=1872145 RepID=UPI00356540EB